MGVKTSSLSFPSSTRGLLPTQTPDTGHLSPVPHGPKTRVGRERGLRQIGWISAWVLLWGLLWGRGQGWDREKGREAMPF